MDRLTKNFLFMYGLADGERHAVPIHEDGSPDCDFWTIRDRIKPPKVPDGESRCVRMDMNSVRTQDYRPLMFVIDGIRDYIFIAV